MFLYNKDIKDYLRIDGIIFLNSIYWHYFCTLDDFLCVIQKEHAEKS